MPAVIAMYYSTVSLASYIVCFCVLMDGRYFLVFFIYISFLAPTSASTALKSSLYRRPPVITVSWIAVCKMHRVIENYPKPQSNVIRHQGDTI